jgi:hypothetical protein
MENNSKVKGEFMKKAFSSFVAIAMFFILGLVFVACSKSENPEADTSKKTPVAKTGKLFAADRVNCSTFTTDDAAAVLGVPAAEIQVDSQELYPGNWMCGYKVGNNDKRVNFNLSLAESVEEAVADMDQYRSHLEIARGTKPFKDDLAPGAFIDISGVGDDALWTAANGTLAVRKGNISIQVQLPSEKDVQIEVAKKFLARL